MSASDRLLAIEAAILMFLARMAVMILPFRWIARKLGNHNETPLNLPPPPSTNRRIKAIASIIERVSRHTPWRSNCLAQAIAGQIMLRRRDIISTIYFGITKDTEGQMAAHAWLRCGEKVITGGSIVDDYTVVGSFTQEPNFRG